ncbi:MAG TPA: ATP-binding protein [Chitinophagaceae bacterium]|nr:ATP-binding protein [Chitinophagaceae bacterium]
MPKDKIDFVILITGVSFLMLMLVIAVVLLFRIYLKRKNKLLLEKELMGIQFEQTLLQSKLEIQEQTFHDISQELHDNIGQMLSLVSINLNTLNAPHENDKIAKMDELLGKALTDLRNLSHSLDADYIRNNGWTGLVIKLLNNLEATGKFSTSVELDDELPSLGNEKPIILFRMIQEVVNNIMKHANAKTIYLKGKKENNILVITIKDDGKGFAENLISEGAGLNNLQNRAKMINAELAISSQPTRGTLVTISIKTETGG